ncbi:MAG: hypothetical protein RBR58_00310 [Candidatus Humimicrobiaceae bacterium]|nr:hypothetical protein [Actinomycetota bacterium]MDD5600978.1 hypothetical protein [Actinomycetota bacterium]MDY0027431.1 hypothetical protein [Candidatus Humimicrobiaceae bacterium]
MVNTDCKTVYFCRAIESKTKENITYATENAFIYFGGVAVAIVIDLLKSAMCVGIQKFSSKGLLAYMVYTE